MLLYDSTQEVSTTKEYWQQSIRCHAFESYGGADPSNEIC